MNNSTDKRSSDATSQQQGRTASVRSTSGSGFDFEDRIGAWLLQQLLCGEPVLDMEVGSGTRLQTQTFALGWRLDDLLVTCGIQPVERQIAISCKSNAQVSSNGLPETFVEAAWEQWDQSDGPMRRGRDRLILMTRGKHLAFQETWTELKIACDGEDSALALGRIRANTKQRTILGSVTGSGAHTEEDAFQLIRHLHVIPTDFHLIPSHHEAAAIGECRRLLVSGDANEARELWRALVDAVRDTRLGNGTLEMSTLWQRLRTRFSLNDHPDFAGSWVALRALTDDHVASLSLALPNQFTLPRDAERGQLDEALKANSLVALHGESGAGKSALARATLSATSQVLQVWLGPDSASILLSETTRRSVGLAHPFLTTLQSTPHRENVLVLDAAERFSPETCRRLQPVIAALTATSSVASNESAWRVLIIAQTQAFEVGLAGLLGTLAVKPIEVGTLSPNEVKAALRSSAHLGWLAFESEIVKALTNLRTLAWVMEAETRFGPQNRLALMSPIGIADSLWQFWTEGQLPLRGLLMRLGVREAKFEHSFPLSELTSADASALQNRPSQLPIRINTCNRIEFQHDLAGEWARFQQLKEAAFAPASWAEYAGNPLWTGALRMLGQFLLRQQVGEQNAWDFAFQKLEANDSTRHATDVLLDALCLDPFAEILLTERAEFLFSDNGARLERLLRRFHHIATVAAPSSKIEKLDPSLRLYVEATQRIPVIGRWPGVVRFLAANRDRVSEFVSTAVADICTRWLSATPSETRDGQPFPLRAELVGLSLSSARALQVMQANSRIMIGDNSEKHIYAAVFAGAPDRPDEVSTWALEMVQRRPWRADVLTRIRIERGRQADEHRQRMQTDAEYRCRHERKESFPTFISSVRRLPAWPLGPSRRLDQRFRETCLQSSALQLLMRARPGVAAEVLLAVIIDDSPTEDYDRSRFDDEDLGLAYDSGNYPTSYWESPFFAFLQINADVAFNTILTLVEFCTARWEDGAKRDYAQDVLPHAKVMMPDGSVKAFLGGPSMLQWSHTSSYNGGALYSALAALEKWLCTLVDGGKDISSYVERILHSSRSVPLLGVLLDVGKYKQELFPSSLLPLLTSAELYFGDARRVEALQYAFVAFSWFQKGELAFNMARDWWSAPYRKAELRSIAIRLVARDTACANVIVQASQAWEIPSDAKSAIELRMLQAELDRRNHRPVKDQESGGTSIGVAYPADLRQQILEYQQAAAPGLRALTLPAWCGDILRSTTVLSQDQASALSDFVNNPDVLGNDSNLEKQRYLARVAAACTLLVAAPSWLERNPATARNAADILESALDHSDEQRSDPYDPPNEALNFAAYVVVNELRERGATAKTSSRVMHLLTSSSIGFLMNLAHAHRAALGPIWYRLQDLSLLWAGLLVLKPYRHRESLNLSRCWTRWLKWLQSRSVAGQTPNKSRVQILNTAERVDRLERRRWVRQSAETRLNFDPSVRRSAGLSTWTLGAAFGWVLVDDVKAIQSLPASELWERSELLRQLLEFEAWHHHSDEHDDVGREPLPSRFGYDVLATIARTLPSLPYPLAKQLWNCVLSLGPTHHYFIGHFLSAFFGTVARDSDADAVTQNWKGMLEFGLDQETWTRGRAWFHGEETLRKLLGFGSEAFLDTVPEYQTAVAQLRPLYEKWADRHLERDEDNVAGLCRFLTRPIGKALRIAGLSWIHRSMSSDPQWRLHRDEAGDTIISLIHMVLNDDADRLSEEPGTRDAVLAITARLVALQLPAALALQENVRSVLTKLESH